MKILVAALTFSLLAGGLALAEPPRKGPGVDRRQQHQERRIRQGVESGQLTTREAERLEAGQERIEKREERMKSDGVLTPAERRKLRQAQDQASRGIQRQKHDSQRTP
ncbi:MAG: hypothetical protein HQM02_04145 [Magnetococcales bacterium]|nr:hypothetical protein [Magnetococcales bacterium]